MSVVGRLIGLAFSDYIFEDSLESEDWGGNASIDGEDVCEVDICLQISCNDSLSILQYPHVPTATLLGCHVSCMFDILP